VIIKSSFCLFEQERNQNQENPKKPLKWILMRLYETTTLLERSKLESRTKSWRIYQKECMKYMAWCSEHTGEHRFQGHAVDSLASYVPHCSEYIR
jgi:hypothetical protein